MLSILFLRCSHCVGHVVFGTGGLLDEWVSIKHSVFLHFPRNHLYPIGFWRQGYKNILQHKKMVKIFWAQKWRKLKVCHFQHVFYKRWASDQNQFNNLSLALYYLPCLTLSFCNVVRWDFHELIIQNLLNKKQWFSFINPFSFSTNFIFQDFNW